MEPRKDRNDTADSLELSVIEQKSDAVVFSIPISVFIGLQYLIPLALNLLHLPLRIFSIICLLPDDSFRGVLISQMFIFAGITTIVQGLLFGARYPLTVGPSAIFISSLVWNFKTVYWECNSDGDLYAMGPELRHSEYLVRTNEVQAVIMATNVATSLVFGICWYFRICLPSLTVSATLISACLCNICLLLLNDNVKELENFSLIKVTLGLLLVFYVFERCQVTSLKVMTNGDKEIKLRTLKVFGVLFAFIIVLVISVYSNVGHESLLRRAFAHYRSLSFNVITEVTIIPEATFRGLLFFPQVLSQVLVSYCCYTLLCNDLDRKMKATLFECIVNVISPMFGVFLPMTVDLSSVGLSFMTEITNSETSVITGASLLVMSWCMGIVDFSSFVPYGLLCGINIYLNAILIYKNLERSIKDLRLVCIPVLIAMVISLLTPDIKRKSYTNLIVVLMKDPIILAFVFSLILIQSIKLFPDNSRV